MCKDNSDAKWQLARDIVKIDAVTRIKIFGTADIAKILDMSVTEVQTSMDVYNNKRQSENTLKYGDEVEVIGSTVKGFVMGFIKNNRFDFNDPVEYWCSVLITNFKEPHLHTYRIKDLKRTGNRLEVDNLIKEIPEAKEEEWK